MPFVKRADRTGGDLVARDGAASQVLVGAAGPANEAGIKLGSAGDTNLYRSGANQLTTDDDLNVNGGVIGVGSGNAVYSATVTLNHSGAGYIDATELAADPAAPAANRGRLYFRDNGAAKTQLVVLFPTGVPIVLATQV